MYPDRDLRWTYKDFDERTDALAKGLLAIGMQPGDHLGVWARNIPDWLTFMYATAKAGIVMVTVNPIYKSHEIDYVLKQSDMKALCIIDAYRDVDYLEIGPATWSPSRRRCRAATFRPRRTRTSRTSSTWDPRSTAASTACPSFCCLASTGPIATWNGPATSSTTTTSS